MFILNFIKYIEWPSNNNTDEIRIAVAGESEIKSALHSLIKMKSAATGRKIKVIDLEENLEYVPCEILFIPSSSSGDLTVLQKNYSGKGVLIVSEGNKSGSKGAAINLINVDNKIRFEIFQSQVKSSGLKVSSRLTDLASNVYP